MPTRRISSYHDDLCSLPPDSTTGLDPVARGKLRHGRVAGSVGMGLRIGSTVVNCIDLEAMTDFWAQALGLAPSSRDPDDDFRVLRGARVNLSLQRAQTPVTARDQMHLDLYSDDAGNQVERLLGLGATKVRENNDPEDTYVVMCDPEGNGFCVCSVVAI